MTTDTIDRAIAVLSDDGLSKRFAAILAASILRERAS